MLPVVYVEMSEENRLNSPQFGGDHGCVYFEETQWWMVSTAHGGVGHIKNTSADRVTVFQSQRCHVFCPSSADQPAQDNAQLANYFG